jgi:hypothetical protein
VADPDPSATPEAPPASSPPPAAANTTTQTITQVQVSTCVSHCSGDTQVQQASQDNTTVQAVGPPVRSDGGTGLAPGPPAHHRSSTTNGGGSTGDGSTPSPAPQPGVTQVQVGCVEHCYGKTTLDHSGLTLAQIEQLLGQLQAPSPPTATAAAGGEQNGTQQSAAQSESGQGNQSQLATQRNATVQVAPAQGGDGDGAAPATDAAPVAVNQTAQGVVQLQVGCIFYCSGTQQTQAAEQSTTTVQSVNGGGAAVANTVSRGVWQVQVGCVAWCYNAVETQTAGASDSTEVAVAPPPGSPAETSGDVAPPSGPAPGRAQSPTVPGGGRSRPSGGAPLEVPGAGVARGPHHPLPRAQRVSVVAVSVSALAQVGGGEAVTSVVTSRTVHTEVARRAGHGGGLRRAAAPAQPAPSAIAGPAAVAATSTALPTLDLALILAGVLALVVMGFATRRWSEVG